MKSLRALPIALLLSCMAPVHAQAGFNLFSAQQDVEIGKQSAVRVEKQLPMLSVPATNQLVERLGQRLAAQAPGPKFTYQFKVVNLSDVNAFALPGGYVYVHRGLVERAQTEGQLAAVVAHEISHVALRHPTQQLTKAYAAQLGLGLVGQLLGGRTGNTTQIINALGGFGLNTLFLKFSRSAESEADAEGARIMARAGYNPVEMANFFAQMRADAGRDPSKVAVFLSDHPSPIDRESRIRAQARTLTVRRAAPLGGLQTAKAELHRLPPAKNMAQLAQAGTTPGTGLRASRMSGTRH